MGLLEGKVAVITGGTRGFGLAVAHAYSREGAAVVVASRSADSVAQAVAQLQEAGGRASGLSCDVGDLVQMQMLKTHALETFGKFDVWVNNAGIAGPYGPMVHIAPETFAAVLQTNIFGTYYGSWIALRYFLAKDERPSPGGKLINVMGRGDRRPVPLQSAYASSKAWIRSFTLALAKEHQDSDVGVYALNPGMMTTDMLTRVAAVAGYESDIKTLETITRMWAKPPRIPAQKAVWLASAATDGRTGLVVREMTVWFMLWGALREGLRRLFGRGISSTAEVDVKTVPSVFPDS